MTIREAVLLTIQAGALGEGGDILVLDMGEPVSIDALARRLARQMAPGRNVEIVYTGLRPGEKLHEELVTERDEPLERPRPRLSRYAVPPLAPNSSSDSRATIGSVVLATQWTPAETTAPSAASGGMTSVPNSGE